MFDQFWIILTCWLCYTFLVSQKQKILFKNTHDFGTVILMGRTMSNVRLLEIKYRVFHNQKMNMLEAVRCLKKVIESVR